MNAAEQDRQVLAQIAQLAASPSGEPGAALAAILNLTLGLRLRRLTDHLLRGGTTVQTGPFAGMKYLTQTVGNLLSPKLLGCYEAELHAAVARIVRKRYDTVVNIGCGEGYYAVGLAMLMPSARVFAFDMDAAAQALCRRLAALNGVAERVTVGGACGHAELLDLARPGVLVLCDCEGAEATLLDPEEAPGLRTCDILVELHDFLDPSTSRRVTERFTGTHEVAFIAQSGRDPHAFSAVRGLSQLDQALAVLEGRPGPTPWAFLTTRAPL